MSADKSTAREKSFAGFSVSLKQDSMSKKRLSNYFTIKIDTKVTEVSQRLTIRQAKALQKWLNENLTTDSDTEKSE